jgi:hypothetical protein
MSLSALWALGAVVTPAGTINQVESHEVDPGIETLFACADGQVDYTFAAVQQQRPILSFTSSAVARALGFCGINGLAISTALDFWFQKLAQGGTRSGGATSTKFTAGKGILVPKSIEADSDGVATIDYEMAAISTDGLAAPLAVAVNASMPAPPSTREYFTAGPVNINGTPVPGVKGIRVDFGIELVIEGSDGEAYPTFSAIMKRKQTIVVRSVDVNLAQTLGFFTPQGVTDSTVFLRKILAGGTRVPNATAEHVKFTIDEGMISCRPVGGRENRPQESELLIEAAFDGTNDPIAVNVASAIS